MTVGGHYGALTINPDGSYSYTANSDITNAGPVTDTFTYTLTDGDGDATTTTLAITIGDGANPTVTQNATIAVDEEGLGTVNATGSNAPSGVESNTGTVTFLAGADNITGVAFGSVAGITADVNGVAGADIVWSANGANQIIGTIGGIEAIHIDLTPPSLPIAHGTSGSATVTVTLLDNFPHPNAAGQNVINLTGITVVASDTDGDTAAATVAVNVTDDVPTAAPDTDSVTEGQIATGNVITDLAAGDAGDGDSGADTRGADGATVTAILSNFVGGSPTAVGAGVTVGGHYGALTINPDGSYSYTANSDITNAGPVTDTFTYTLTDGDGDATTTTLAITIGDGANPTVTQNATIAVDEEGLGTVNATGSNAPSGVESNTGTVTFLAGADNITGVAFGSVAGITADVNGVAGADIVWSANGANQIIGTIGGIEAIHIDLTPPSLPIAHGTSGSATVTVTLLDNFPHPNAAGQNVINLTGITVVASDTDGDTAAATVAVNVTDDVPTASDNTRQVLEGTLQSADVQFIVDLSGSMFASGGGGVGFDVPGFSDDRIGLARYSMQQLLLSNDQIENVQIIRFGDFASGTLWLTKAQALTFIQNDTNWTSLGGTNYDAALQQAITSFGSGPASSSEQSIVYFMSDGAPTAGGGITSDDSGSNVSIAEWESHVTTKGIDQVFAIGIGNGVNVDNLEPIAFPNTDVQAPIGAEDNVILVSTSDVVALPNRLQDALELHSTISGNILLNDPGTERRRRHLRRRRWPDSKDHD